MNMITLRGGGMPCSTPANKNINKVAPGDSINDIQLVEMFLKNVSQRCDNILKASQNIGLQEEKDGIIREIKWFQLSSKYFNKIILDSQKVSENIQLVFKNLETLLIAILNIIQTQQFLSYHLLKVCNLFSQQIFIYFINKPDPPMKLEKQQNYLNLLAEIMKYIEFGGQNFYQNGIIYEFEIINMCINTCPTDSTQGQDKLITAFQEIISSVAKMSPSTGLITALVDGTIFVYQKVQQQNQKKIFQVLFYLERLKWSIIENVQDGVGINTIRQSLIENYKKLVKDQNQWIIKCSWIKLQAELLQYALVIDKWGYEKLVNKYNLNKDWNKIIKLKFIYAIDEHSYIGLINHNNNNDQVARIFREQFVTFNQLKSTCLNGYSDIPKFDAILDAQIKISAKVNQQKLVQILEYADNLQILSVSNMYKELLSNLSEYIETWNFLLQSEDLDIEQQQNKIDLLIVFSQKMEDQLQNLIFNSRIINKQLESFDLSQDKQITIEEQKSHANKLQKFYQYHYYLLILNYFNIIKPFSSKDYNILADHQEYIELFPEIKLKEQIKQLDQQKLFQNIICQQKIQDFIQLNVLLNENVSKTQDIGMESNQKIKEYQKLMSQYIDVVLDQFRQDLGNQQNILYLLEQTIIKTNQITIDKTITQNIKQYQVYYTILSHMITIYEEIDQMLGENNFSDKQVEDFKFLGISEIFQIFNSALDQEYKSISQYQFIKQNFIENLSIQQKLEYMLILLDTQKSVLQNKYAKLQKFSNQVKVYKQQYRIIIEEQSSKDFEYQQLLIQNIQSLINLLEQSNQRQDFMKFLEKRKQLLQSIQIKYKTNVNLNNQIQKEIQFTSSVNQEQFYEFIEQNSSEFIKKLNQSNQIIIQLLDEMQQPNISQTSVEIITTIIDGLDQIVFYINKHKTNDQDMERENTTNKLIFELSNLIFDIEQISEEVFEVIQKQVISTLESTQKIQIFDDQKINQMINKNIDLIQKIPLTLVSLKSFIIKDQKQQQIIEQKQLIQQSKGLIQKINEFFEDDSWRYKEYFYFQCLQTYSVVIDKEIKQKLGTVILLGRFKETDFRIRQSLKNNSYQQQIEQLVNNEWENSKESIQDTMQMTLNSLQSIQLQLQGEERKLQRENLIQKHKQLESKLEQQMKNINEIGDILGITIYFMKDIKKELILLQSKLDSIVDSLNQIGQDIKYLRGKTPQQLLEIRMEQVLQNKNIQDAQSVYVQIYVKEFDFKDMKEKDITHLFNYDQFQDGEIDEFLMENSKISLLIHGPAGSGKSITARKIEEYLWLQYKKQLNGQDWNQYTHLSIPIFIQLPTLKEPKFTAIEETLQSQIYKFDQKQINQFLDYIQNSQIHIIFIMDSYDELANQYQGSNLIQTNKIQQWKQKKEQKNPKVIFTSRSEIFTTSNYRAWFWENDIIGLNSLKEIKLQQFNSKQREEFLYQFSQLQLKQYIKDLLEIVSKQQKIDLILQSTQQIFDQIQTNSSLQRENLLDDVKIKQLIKIIKQNPNVINLSIDQEISFVKQIQSIWSVDQYQQSIQQMKIEEILDTPFIINIVVQVLPQMSENLSSQNYIKEQFSQTYIHEKRKQIKTILKMHKSNNQSIKLRYDIENMNKFEKILNNKNNDEIKNECIIIWNCLIDSNFFKDFNVIQKYQDVITTFNKMNTLNTELENNIANKERLIDNYVIIYNSLSSKKSNIFEFYKCFLDYYIEQQRQKLIYSNIINDQNQFLIDVNQFATNFAVTMTLSNVNTVEIQPKGILFQSKEEANPFEKFFDDKDSLGNYRMVIRKCLPLKQKSYFYSFNHKTIQEYLFAKDIIQFMLDINLELDQILNNRIQDGDKLVQSNQNSFKEKFINSSLNHINIMKPQSQGFYKFIQVVLKSNQQLQDVCYKLTLLSSICEQLVTLSSNAFYILANVQNYIKLKDFTKINIEDLSLNETHFIECNFSDSRFRRISLNSTQFTQCNLSRVNWTECYTHDLPIFQIEKSLLCICYSIDDKQVIGGDHEGFLYIWDKQSLLQVQKFQVHKEIVYQVRQIINNFIITVGIDDSVLNFKIWNNDKLQGQEEISSERSIKSKLVQFLQTFTHNNFYIAIVLKDKVKIISIENQLLRLERSCNQSFSYIKLSNHENEKGKLLCFSQESMEIEIWNFKLYTTGDVQIQTAQLIKIIDFKWKQLQLQTIFSEDCEILYFFKDRKIILFNLLNQQVKRHKIINECKNLILTSNNQYLAYNSKNILYIYDAKNFICLSQQVAQKASITQICFNQQYTEMITSSYDGTAKFWDFKMILQNQQNSVQELQGVKKIQYSPDGSLFYFSILNQDNLYIVCSKTNKLIDRISCKLQDFHVCITGRFIYFIHDMNFIQYDINNKKHIQLYQKQGWMVHRYINYFITYQTQDSKLFLIQSTNKTLQVEIFKQLNLMVCFIDTDANIIKIQNFDYFQAQLSQDQQLIFYQYKNSIKAMRIQTNQTEFLQQLEQPKFEHHHWDEILDYILTKDGKQLISLVNNKNFQFYLWNIDNNELINKFETMNSIKQIQISFDNKYIIAMGYSDFIILYDTEQFQIINKFKGGNIEKLTNLIVSPTQQQFITIGDECIVKLWKISKTNKKDYLFNDTIIFQKFLIQRTLINEAEWKESKIFSHLNIDLANLWMKKEN